ncbi:MAG: sec-independent protein translocase protein TatA [Cryomorphaceae bacterium]|jgi:sec-independent protein translocase protein TatA
MISFAKSSETAYILSMSDITQTLAFAFGGQEMILVFLIVLLLFGAKKLPQLARGIGKSTGEFKRARDEFEREITRAEVEATTETSKVKEAEEENEVKEKIENKETVKD